MQTTVSTLYSDLRKWFRTHNVSPRIKAEVEDRALLKVFGEKGLGIFSAPAVIEHEITANTM